MDTYRQAIIANISGRRRRFRRGVQDRGEEEELEEEEEATSITSWVTNSLGGLKREGVDALMSRDSSAGWLESFVKGVVKEKEENRMLDPAGRDGHKEAVKEDKENEEDKKDNKGKEDKEDKEDEEDKEEVGENDERCIVLTWRCLSQVFHKAKLTINSDDDSFLHILQFFTTAYCFLLLKKTILLPFFSHSQVLEGGVRHLSQPAGLQGWVTNVSHVLNSNRNSGSLAWLLYNQNL